MVYNDGRLDCGDSVRIVMMPGDSQGKTAAIAADATVGNCTNCSLLHQSLTEYVSSFLALKQKITVSDDTIRLQQKLEELQMHLVTLEKKTADYESVQAELEEKKSSLKAHEHLSKEMEKLKGEHGITVAQNKKLEDQLKCVKDLTDTQSLENAQLMREKAAIENDLLQTQAFLKKSQAQADKAEKLVEENIAVARMKENLENKVRLLEDSISKQNHQIFQLTNEKTLLERNIFDLQTRLMKLERDRCKDFRSSTTQTSAATEPKLDKDLDTNTNDEVDNEDKESHLEPPEDSPYKRDALHITTSLSNQNSPDSLDFMETAAWERQPVSTEKDFGNNGMSDVEPDKDREKMHHQNDMLPEEDPTSAHLVSASLPLSSSTTDSTMYEVVSLTPESLESSCTLNLYDGDPSNISGPDNSVEQAKEDNSKNVTKTDGDTGLGGTLDNKAVISNSEGLLRGSDESEIVEEAEDGNLDAPPKRKELMKGITVRENSSEVKKGDAEFGPDSKDSAAVEHRKSTGSLCRDSEMLEYTTSSSNDGTSATSSSNDGTSATSSSNDGTSATSSSNDNVKCALKENLDETMEIDEPIQLCGENDAREAAQGTEGDDITASNSKSSSDNKPLRLEKPLVLKREDEPDFDNETLKSKVMTEAAPVFPESPGTITVDRSSLEEKTNCLNQEPSPACAVPAVKTQPLETHPNTGESNVDNTEHLLHVDQQRISEIVDVKDPSQDNIDAVSTVSFVGNTGGTEEQNKCLEPCAKAHEKGPCRIIEGNSSSVSSPQTPKHISHIRSEMGPPLPPVLTPLSTPPREGKSINPRHAIGKLLFPSPMREVASPTTPSQTHITPNSKQLNSSSINSPLPPNGVPSSPLQFGSATPKHAVPVPGRLPSKAMNSSPSSSASPPQENSMRILDTMYPELSAHAWTLSILRGNVNLSICSSENGSSPTMTDSQISGFKTISSTSTAFTKTEIRGEKRPAVSLSQAKNGKCQKLDRSSPGVTGNQVSSISSNSGDKRIPSQTLTVEQLSTSPSMKAEEPSSENLIVNSLKKIQNQCFDLLPVVQSHLYVGNLPKKPVLRDEEREVISDIYHRNLGDDMILAILNKLKAEKTTLSTNYMQALCRVYTGICRQNRDWEKARILAYSILVEDFPDSAKLILFMVTTWPTFLSHSSSLCQAVHSITKLKAQEGVLNCLSTFLHWEMTPPCNIDQLISTTLSGLTSGPHQSFTEHSRYGEDLGTEAWEIVFTLHLLCSGKKWKWIYQNVMGNVLWPLLNTWVAQPRDQQQPICDVTIATVLRLVGRLGQLGLKERCVASVKTVASVINTFGRQGQAEGVPWEVQLAAVYCIYDLSPCDPKQALDVLACWRGETTQCVPPAVTSCINQLGSICRQLKN
ncbi:little elongation complex subunit 1 [Xenentodon cancila]